MTEEEVKRVLMNNPEIIADALVAKPHVLYEVLSKLTPWQNLATKDDLRRLEEKMATKDDLKNLVSKDDAKNFATKDDLKNLVSKDDAKNFATKDDLKNLVSKDDAKNFATKDDLKNLVSKDDAKNFATKDDLKNLVSKDDAKNFATKDDLKNLVSKDDAKNFATKDELELSINKAVRKLENLITALGARWGIMSEDAFREGVREILKDTGLNVTREVLYDRTGYVFGDPSDIEIDVVVKNGKVVLVEIMSSLKRGDLPIVERKKEFYERERNLKVDSLIVVTPFIHDKYPERLKAFAKDRGIEVTYPE
ncbi:hypothetical protein HS7_13570 [Sulfolobales archaeon HS-7]|nr:hypothetical protein HS7_13570 [Sulfolobales archaeon HS-7]